MGPEDHSRIAVAQACHERGIMLEPPCPNQPHAGVAPPSPLTAGPPTPAQAVFVAVETEIAGGGNGQEGQGGGGGPGVGGLLGDPDPGGPAEPAEPAAPAAGGAVPNQENSVAVPPSSPLPHFEGPPPPPLTLGDLEGPGV